MGYMHIHNGYRPEVAFMLELRRVYALEKVHGTSANIDYDESRGGNDLLFHPGEVSHTRFVGLFDVEALRAAFKELGHPKVRVYGENAGGKLMGMSATYGMDLFFIAFEVQIGETWLNVPNAADVARKLNIEFVPYWLIDCTIEAMDRERDRDSEVAVRRGILGKKREGVVLRPTVEIQLSNGDRLISKHKREEFQERGNQPAPAIDPAKLAVLEAAQAIADEWVTPRRLEHVLQHLAAAGTPATEMKHTAMVIKEMVQDVYREGKGEIVESKAAESAIGKKAAGFFKTHVTALHAQQEASAEQPKQVEANAEQPKALTLDEYQEKAMKAMERPGLTLSEAEQLYKEVVDLG